MYKAFVQNQSGKLRKFSWYRKPKLMNFRVQVSLYEEALEA